MFQRLLLLSLSLSLSLSSTHSKKVLDIGQRIELELYGQIKEIESELYFPWSDISNETIFNKYLGGHEPERN